MSLFHGIFTFYQKNHFHLIFGIEFFLNEIVYLFVWFVQKKNAAILKIHNSIDSKCFFQVKNVFTLNALKHCQHSSRFSNDLEWKMGIIKLNVCKIGKKTVLARSIECQKQISYINKRFQWAINALVWCKIVGFLCASNH